MGAETEDRKISLKGAEIVKCTGYERARNTAKRKGRKSFSSNLSGNNPFLFTLQTATVTNSPGFQSDII